MSETHSLRLMLDRGAIDDGMLELLDDGLVDGVTLWTTSASPPEAGRAGSVVTYKIFDGAGGGAQHHRRAIIRQLSLGLRIDPTQVQVLPHHLHQLVQIPAVLGADGAGVGNPVQQVQLFDADGVDLVQGVDDRNVFPILGLQDVNQIINGRITPDGDVGGRDSIFAHDGSNLLHGLRQPNALIKQRTYSDGLTS